MALLGEVCLAAVNICPLYWHPQRNENVLTSFQSVQLQHVLHQTTLRVGSPLWLAKHPENFVLHYAWASNSV